VAAEVSKVRKTSIRQVRWDTGCTGQVFSALIVSSRIRGLFGVNVRCFSAA
jgi:hypothetical protein